MLPESLTVDLDLQMDFLAANVDKHVWEVSLDMDDFLDPKFLVSRNNDRHNLLLASWLPAEKGDRICVEFRSEPASPGLFKSSWEIPGVIA